MSLLQYLRDTKGELAHISWPTRNKAILFTILVVVLSVFTAVYLGLFDSLFVYFIKTFVTY